MSIFSLPLIFAPLDAKIKGTWNLKGIRYVRKRSSQRRDELTGSTAVGALSRVSVVPCVFRVTLRLPRAVAPRVILVRPLSPPARYAQIKIHFRKARLGYFLFLLVLGVMRSRCATPSGRFLRDPMWLIRGLSPVPKCSVCRQPC